MKISVNDIKTTPKNMDFNLCVWGTPNQKVSEWISFWGLKTSSSGKFTNIEIGDKNLFDLFDIPDLYEYVDGFSPNLNKNLHLGHLSNLVIAKSFQSLGIGNKYISILGDTLEGVVKQEDALDKFYAYCNRFGYKIDDVFFASNQILKDSSLLVDGEGDYEGTKVFNLGDSQIVGIKSSGSTTYFYQDVALAQNLGKSTLYVTGFEQNGHFSSLKKMFPHINHIGLGLVTIDGKKMSSSEGNVIFADEVFDIIKSKFEGDENLSWNVLCGYILKYDPKSNKNIDLKSIDDVKSSYGLYLSYTLAKLKSAGMIPSVISEFNSNQLKFKFIKSKVELSPHYLFEELINHAVKISQMYTKLFIKDNPDNQKLYQPLLDDLLLGMKSLGMVEIDKV